MAQYAPSFEAQRARFAELEGYGRAGVLLMIEHHYGTRAGTENVPMICLIGSVLDAEFWQDRLGFEPTAVEVTRKAREARLREIYATIAARKAAEQEAKELDDAMGYYR